MTDILRKIRERNGLIGHAVAEPFAGGAGASLSQLCLRETHEIHINDLDQGIYDFWSSAVHDSSALRSCLEEAPITVEEWRRWRAVHRSREVTHLDRGFATFYLNRCNRSGIIQNGGVIGGIEQRGRWKIDARYNKDVLLERLERIAAERDRIFVTCLDGIDFNDTLDRNSTFYYIDPPYFSKGPALYLNRLEPEYHGRLAAKLRSMEDAAWAVTYDDCPEIHAFYGDWASMRQFSLRYTAQENREGEEVLITPGWIHLP